MARSTKYRKRGPARKTARHHQEQTPRQQARREERRKKYARPWSPDRPQKPDFDPLLEDLIPKLQADKRSTWVKANKSGLSTTTFYNWDKSKVRRPNSVSLQMAYNMLGYELRAIPIGAKIIYPDEK